GLVHHPVECQLEVRELVTRDDVAARTGPDERAIDRLPPFGHAVAVVAAPSTERAAIEQRAPSVLVFGSDVCFGIRRIRVRPSARGYLIHVRIARRTGRRSHGKHAHGRDSHWYRLHQMLSSG